MLSEKGWIGIIVAILTLSLFLFNACSDKSTQEKMFEKTLKQATGKDVDIKMQGGQNSNRREGFQDGDSENGNMASRDVYGCTEIYRWQNRARSQVSRARGHGKFNIYLVDINGDDIKNYDGALKEKGWQTDLMQMGDKGGYLNAQKGTMGMNFGFSLERKDGMLAVYNGP